MESPLRLAPPSTTSLARWSRLLQIASCSALLVACGEGNSGEPVTGASTEADTSSTNTSSGVATAIGGGGSGTSVATAGVTMNSGGGSAATTTTGPDPADSSVASNTGTAGSPGFVSAGGANTGGASPELSAGGATTALGGASGASGGSVGNAGSSNGATASGGVGGTAQGGAGGQPAMSSLCPDSPGTPPSGTITPTLIAEIQPLDDAFHLFEGPVWVGDTLYFSDIAPDPWRSSLRRFVPATRAVTDFLLDSGSNGLALAPDGTLYSATAGKGEVSRYTLSPPGQQTVISGQFNSPNDIAIANDGTIYFSDPPSDELPPGDQPQVVYVVKDGVAAVFSEELQAPNGVTLSPEQDVLYVTGGGQGGYLRKVTLLDGLAGPIQELKSGLEQPDGMVVDCAGNIYMAVHGGNRIDVMTKDGDSLATINVQPTAEVEDTRPTNVAFGGPERKTLYITAVYSVWEVPLDIAGYPY